VTWRHLAASCAVPLVIRQVWLPPTCPHADAGPEPRPSGSGQAGDPARATLWTHLSRGDRLCSDGGLLNPLPLYAAVDLGATEILALHALPEIPSPWLQPFAKAFRVVFGVNRPLPPGVSTRIILPSRKLGGMRDALHWKRENIEAWLELGRRDAEKTFPL
jgi:predicted acylesterase/phospholipase RssA